MKHKGKAPKMSKGHMKEYAHMSPKQLSHHMHEEKELLSEKKAHKKKKSKK